MDKPILVGFCGKAGSGKDTAATAIAATNNADIIHFADPLKQHLQLLLGFTEAQVYGEDKNKPDPRYGGGTARTAMQLFGTEFGRTFYGNLWVDLTENRVKDALARGTSVLVPDVRFENEANMIVQNGGLLVRVVRDGFSYGMSTKEMEHASEAQAYDEAHVYCDIRNDGSLASFESDARTLFCELYDRARIKIGSSVSGIAMADITVLVSIIGKLVDVLSHEDPSWWRWVYKEHTTDEVARLWMKLVAEAGIAAPQLILPATRYVPIRIEEVMRGDTTVMEGGWYVYDSIKKKHRHAVTYYDYKSCAIECEKLNEEA
jgi:hypothetical protein